jgi:hypothetical protein
MGTREYARMFNNYLDAIRNRIFETHRELLAAGESVSAETKKTSLPGSLNVPITFGTCRAVIFGLWIFMCP